MFQNKEDKRQGSRHLVFPGVGWIILMIAGLLRKVYGAVEQTMDVRGKQNALVIQHAPLDQRVSTHLHNGIQGIMHKSALF